MVLQTLMNCNVETKIYDFANRWEYVFMDYDYTQTRTCVVNECLQSEAGLIILQTDMVPLFKLETTQMQK